MKKIFVLTLILLPAVISGIVDTQPLDNIGIVSKVAIPVNVKDWVEYVRTYKLVH